LGEGEGEEDEVEEREKKGGEEEGGRVAAGRHRGTGGAVKRTVGVRGIVVLVVIVLVAMALVEDGTLLSSIVLGPAT
jgi:hypothetical protein